MRTPLYVKKERFTFPTGNTLSILTTRGFRRQHGHRSPYDPTIAALLHLMLVYNVRALRNRQELHRFVGILHRDHNGVAMAHRVLSDGPLVTLEKDGLRVPVYLEDVVGMQGIALPTMELIPWHRMNRINAMIHLLIRENRMERATGFKIIRKEQGIKDLSAMTDQEQELEMGIRSSARRALHHLLGSLHAELQPGPELLRR